MGSGGNFVMQMAPKVKKCIILGDQIFVLTKNTYDCAFLSKVVTATDEDELAARIRKAEEENAEVRKLMFFFQASANISHSSFVDHDRIDSGRWRRG